ncbi:hypothetical protein AFL22_22825 [Pantoea sp. CFSAN033090]|nr:hypothetical protein AFL22_22825 [Pantoea sp. CFSAN033090]
MSETETGDIGQRIGHNTPYRQLLTFVQKGNGLIAFKLLKSRNRVYKQSAKHKLSINFSHYDVPVLRCKCTINCEN